MGIETALPPSARSTELHARQAIQAAPSGQWFADQLTVANAVDSGPAIEAQKLLESLGGNRAQGAFSGSELKPGAENFGLAKDKDGSAAKQARALFGDVVPGSESAKNSIEAALEVLDPDSVAQNRARSVIDAAMLVFQEQGWQLLTVDQFSHFIGIIASPRVTPKSAAYAAAGMELAMGTNKVSGLSNLYSGQDGWPFAGRYQINASAGSKIIVAPSGSKRLNIDPQIIQRMSSEIFANPSNPSAWSEDTQLAVDTYKGYGAAAIAASYGYR